MPALLDRPKLSNAMARALHKHIMRERERKRQEEEEVDKMMEQKMKEEEERKRTKEIEERMSLEETKEQVMKMGEKLQGLQEEKHQLFLQLKKVLHEEEKRPRCFSPQMSSVTSLTPVTSLYSSLIPFFRSLIPLSGSPVSHNRAGGLMSERSKQLFPTPVNPNQAGFSAGPAEHGQFGGSQSVHESYGVAQTQHPSTYAPGPSVPVSFASSSQIRGVSAFQAMQYLPHQQPGYAVHSHFTSQPGFIPGAGIPLQKQLEHANQQSGFTDAGALRPMHPQALHTSAAGLLPTSSMAVQIPTPKVHLITPSPPHILLCCLITFHWRCSVHQGPFQSSPQAAPRHALLPHTQSGQRFYHHSK
uniref:G protein pathway suppressor 2 n=1 Tax=Salmo trutta TaxID=8032 RepID=A0A674EEX7_SALTR